MLTIESHTLALNYTTRGTRGKVLDYTRTLPGGGGSPRLHSEVTGRFTCSYSVTVPLLLLTFRRGPTPECLPMLTGVSVWDRVEIYNLFPKAAPFPPPILLLLGSQRLRARRLAVCARKLPTPPVFCAERIQRRHAVSVLVRLAALRACPSADVGRPPPAPCVCRSAALHLFDSTQCSLADSLLALRMLLAAAECRVAGAAGRVAPWRTASCTRCVAGAALHRARRGLSLAPRRAASALVARGQTWRPRDSS